MTALELKNILVSMSDEQLADLKVLADLCDVVKVEVDSDFIDLITE